MYLKAGLNTPVSYISGGQFISNEPWKHARRCIDSFELIVGVKGMLPIRQDEQEFGIKPAETLLLLPGHVHEGYAYAKEGLSFYWVHFHCRSPYRIIHYQEAVPEITRIKRGMDKDELRQNVYIPLYAN